MTHTRTTIHKGPKGVTLTVRSTRLPTIYVQRSKLPSVAAAHREAPDLRAEVDLLVARAGQREGAPS